MFFEFYPNQCYVKHQDTKEILLHEKLKDDLHVFPSFHHYFAFSTHNTIVSPMLSSYQLWHSRLGHALAKIVHQVMNNCNIPYVTQIVM